MNIIWIACYGNTVIGFSAEDLNAFERSLKQLRKSVIVEYWSYFNWYFEEQLHGYVAYAISTL